MQEHQNTPQILVEFADLLGTDLKHGKLIIPDKYGNGFCEGFVFDEHIRMLISNYELNKEIDINNPEKDLDKKIIFFKFEHVFTKTKKSIPKMIPSVLIGTSKINTTDIISVHSNAETINIEVDADYLSKILGDSVKSPIVQSLLLNKQPLLFEQIIYPSLQHVIDEIVTEQIDDTFKIFFLKIKAEELICRLLIELQKRDEKTVYPLNAEDIQTMYRIRDLILKQLDVPPTINGLSIQANMSPTKLKRQFKQIFGDSIFSYYQAFRIKEAARLLKEESLSVSDVGFTLGFTNLSHFSRVFNEHMGMNPKQYSRS